MNFTLFYSWQNKYIKNITEIYSNISSPQIINFICIKDSESLPDLELCRKELENLMDENEEMNYEIKQYAESLIYYDSILRKFACCGKLKWKEYSILKQEIISELIKCNTMSGTLYKKYRQNIRCYRTAISMYQIQYENITSGIKIN